VPASAPGAERGPRTNYRSAERSTGRTTLLIVGGLLAAIVVVVVLVSVLGGSPKGKGASGVTTVRQTSSTHAKSPPATSTTTTTSAAPPANAAETPVAVLNGTETTGLAHRVSSELQQAGYSQAAALSGRPQGANQQTVVQYASGHRGEAEAVARSLGVGQVQPIEAQVSSLASSASVVVVVGADRASGQ
jgi:hypothetical protein